METYKLIKVSNGIELSGALTRSEKIEINTQIDNNRQWNCFSGRSGKLNWISPEKSCQNLNSDPIFLCSLNRRANKKRNEVLF